MIKKANKQKNQKNQTAKTPSFKDTSDPTLRIQNTMEVTVLEF